MKYELSIRTPAGQGDWGTDWRRVFIYRNRAEAMAAFEQQTGEAMLFMFRRSNGAIGRLIAKK